MVMAIDGGVACHVPWAMRFMLASMLDRDARYAMRIMVPCMTMMPYHRPRHSNMHGHAISIHGPTTCHVSHAMEGSEGGFGGFRFAGRPPASMRPCFNHAALHLPRFQTPALCLTNKIRKARHLKTPHRPPSATGISASCRAHNFPARDSPAEDDG